MRDDATATGDDPNQADHFLVGQLPDRLQDRGPRYKETPPDPYASSAPAVAEPWNTVTAALFVVIVLGWVARLRGRFREYPFLACCLPILLAGGVGGTLYHAYRTRLAYFLLDVIPIQLLGLAGSIYLTTRLVRGAKLWRVIGIAVGLLVVFAAVNEGLFRALNLPLKNLRVNLNYAALAIIILVPLGAVLVRTRFRHVGWVAGGLAAFAVAWFFRLIDGTPSDTLPMGTHWLWHTFGAITTQATMEYFYRIEGEGLKAHG